MLRVISFLKHEEWDKIVKSFSDYDVYYLSGYVLPFAIHGDGEPLLFFYEGEKVRAMNVVMRRDIGADKSFMGKIPPNTYYYFITPYGYGGWLIEGNGDTFELFSLYQKWCCENGVVSEFLRLHPILENHNRLVSIYSVINIGKTVAMDLTSQNIIWNNMTSKNRNMIRKAEKNGVVIKTSSGSDIYEKFIEIYNETMDRDNAEKYYYFEREFYTAMQHDLSNNSIIFYAENSDGDIIASSIILHCNGKLTYHLSGVKTEFRGLAPTNLLLYKAALWGAENCCRIFHLGGGVGAREDSLYRFKASFYRELPRDYFIGKKVFNEAIYNELVKIHAVENTGNFFPAYRGK